jgi:hypothetical protein
MEFCDFILKDSQGKNTTLDKEYSKLIKNVINGMDEETEARWEIYNLIIKELIDIDNGKYFKEIKYRLTDGENANKVILSIISRYDPNELSNLIWILKKKLEEFEEDDFFKRFY